MTSDELIPSAEQGEQKGPLLSFCLFAYNQEAFIRSAVHSALAQTYSPLEIIISDDCSNDRTFDIIREETLRYDGPHQVSINRCSKNLRPSLHLSSILARTKGDLVIVAAGDDISLPERVSKLYERWETTSRKTAGVFSNVRVIDSTGREGEKWCNTTSPQYPRSVEAALEEKNCLVFGCSCAYSRAVIDKFPTMDRDVVQEDAALGLRVLLCGGFEYIDKCLVLYRRHEGNTYVRNVTWWQTLQNKPSLRFALGRPAIYKTWIADLIHVKRLDLIERYRLREFLAASIVESELFSMSRTRSLVTLLKDLLFAVPFRRWIRLLYQHVLWPRPLP